MTPTPQCTEPPEQAISAELAKMCTEVLYSEQRVGEVYRVEAVCDSGKDRYVWLIDPALGWNATQVERWRDGKLAVRCLTEYEKVDGFYFPASVAFFNEKDELLYVAQTYQAEINTSDLPRELAPEHIGVETGMSVYPANPKGAPVWRTYLADGVAVPIAEFDRLRKERGLEFGQRMTAKRQNQSIPRTMPDPKKVTAEVEAHRGRLLTTRPADEWERYTLTFIDHHKLDDEQRQKAMLILRQCQAQRDHYLRGRKRQLEEAQQRLAAASTDDARNRAQDALAALHAPAPRIFEGKLKPRLADLLTRAQRAASAPAGPSSDPP